MQETGDWIAPRLYGKPWFEKPPLYYWSAALSFKLFGVSETTAGFLHVAGDPGVAGFVRADQAEGGKVVEIAEIEGGED